LPTHAEGREYRYPYLDACQFPKLFLSGGRDQYAPVDELRAVVDAAPEPKQFIAIEGADHFFTGKLEAMQAALAAWLQERFLAPAEASTEAVLAHENNLRQTATTLKQPTTTV
jgi:alpha/beta superfamily hydrolase